MVYFYAVLDQIYRSLGSQLSPPLTYQRTKARPIFRALAPRGHIAAKSTLCILWRQKGIRCVFAADLSRTQKGWHLRLQESWHGLVPTCWSLVIYNLSFTWMHLDICIKGLNVTLDFDSRLESIMSGHWEMRWWTWNVVLRWVLVYAHCLKDTTGQVTSGV
jgi:hypothetical protein